MRWIEIPVGRLILVLCAVLAGAAVSGCASNKKADEEFLHRRPRDFSIDMAVFAPADVTGLPGDLLPGVFMLKPGGAVYIAMGSAAIDRRHPPFTGRMSPDESDRVWTLIENSGLFDTDNPSHVSASSMVGKRYTRSVAGLVVTANGQRRWYRVTLNTPTADAATVRALIGHLGKYGPMP